MSRHFPCIPRPGDVDAGMVGLALKWVRLATNGTNLGHFRVIFQYILACSSNQNVLKSDLKSPDIQYPDV